MSWILQEYVIIIVFVLFCCKRSLESLILNKHLINYQVVCGWLWLVLPRRAALRHSAQSCGCVYACRNAANHINRLILARICPTDKGPFESPSDPALPSSPPGWQHVLLSLWVSSEPPQSAKTTIQTGCISKSVSTIKYM